ncbi:hypothetical protein [Lactiplantibacillus mudanjiangensis]|uniref:Uncharacterized protein n=1 Tax=Lactiplantibacillus mudanjiangensis TaxID=1296538 RepID=A0A660E1G5_9LACO|nr:hypothetical protein [Lactiplantibacillus mudanjiangensis]VDG26360.1 hypothetical protein MUDAN_IGPPGNFN_01707 [Lactiplantibacillus mudanjiangensis]VDG27886.1 hypothetical protein MUDAN_MDHGFNIF_02702 [Lactiplantibacillus mudanjiangensis]
MTIKRGSKVVWHRPAFDKTVEKRKYGRVVRDDQGEAMTHLIHHPKQDIDAQCFGVINRRYDGGYVLIMRHGKGKMMEVPLDQVEEVEE